MNKWKKVKISDYLIHHNTRYGDNIKQDKQLEVYGVSNVLGITITKHKKSSDLSKYVVIKPKYLAYNPYRINVGSIGLVHHNTIGLVSPAYVVFSTDTEKLLPELLFSFLKSRDGLFEIKKNAKGTVRQALRYKNLCDIEMVIPPMEVQRKIIKKKTKADSYNFKLKNEFINQKNLLQKLRQAVLQDAIEGKLTANWRKKNPDIEPASELLKKIKAEKEKLIKNKELKLGMKTTNPKTIKDTKIPNTWGWSKGDNIFFVTKLAGFEYSKYIKLTQTGDVPVVRAQNVKPFNLNKKNLLYIDNKTSKLLDRCALTKRCLLVTFIGAGIGDICIFNENTRWHLAPNVAKMEPYKNCDDLIDLKYFNYFTLSKKGQFEIFKHVKATAQPCLSMATIRDIDFIIPPIAEQKAIVTKVENLMQELDKLEAEISQNQKTADMLMQAVLKEAFYQSH